MSCTHSNKNQIYEHNDDAALILFEEDPNLHFHQDEIETEYLQNHPYVILELSAWDYFSNNNSQNKIVRLTIQNTTTAQDLIDLARIFKISSSNSVQELRQVIFLTGILPVLCFVYDINLSISTELYNTWHSTVRQYIDAKNNAIINAQLACYMVLTTTDIGINLMFYPPDVPRPIFESLMSLPTLFSFACQPGFGGSSLCYSSYRFNDDNVQTDSEYHDIPWLQNRDHSKGKKYFSLELMHRRLGHRKCRTLLAANEHHLWEDAMVCMSLEMGCLSYSIATIKASARNKDHHTAASHPGKYVFLDILHPITRTGLTTKTSYAFYLIIVDAYFPYCTFHSLPDKSTAEVIQAPSQYQADHKPANEYGFIDLVHIWSDAGSQFTVEEFAKHCKQAGITLTLATPKKQHHNHLAECTWQTISSMMHTLLVHGHLPDSFWFHGLQYAAHIFNILPIRGLTAAQSDTPATPWQLFYGTRPLAATFGFSAARSPCTSGLLLNAPTGNRPNVASAVSLSVVILIKRGSLFSLWVPASLSFPMM